MRRLGINLKRPGHGVGGLIAFWSLVLLAVSTPVQIQRWRQGARPNDARQRVQNVAATSVARWEDKGLISFERTEDGVTADLTKAAPEWATLSRSEQAAVSNLCRQLTRYASPVTRCIIRDSAGHLLLDDSGPANN